LASLWQESTRAAELWSLENASAFICWNDYIEKNGLPLEKHSSF
jgi:post-segregation antitoxin (ccd killing protein)